jgi:hypothetical protein
MKRPIQRAMSISIYYHIIFIRIITLAVRLDPV